MTEDITLSNQIDHRGPESKRNKRRKERARKASGCSGEGHNGAIGLAKWKTLSRRSERRAAGKSIPRIGKIKKLNVRKHTDSEGNPVTYPKVLNGRPKLYDMDTVE